MEQKDYILREIEKIGTIIQAIRQKLFGGGAFPASGTETNMAAVKTRIIDELNLDLQKLDDLNDDELYDYLSNLQGFNCGNIENLAELLYQIAENNNFKDAEYYLPKSLRLYEFVIKKTKTFSLQRANIMANIKNHLSE